MAARWLQYSTQSVIQVLLVRQTDCRRGNARHMLDLQLTTGVCIFDSKALGGCQCEQMVS
jgi:hypothetical protein